MASPGKPTTISNPGFKATRTKSKKKHFVQQKVEVFRASTPALSVFMWGIIHTVNDLCHVPVPIMLLPDDFKANRKIKVSNHLFNKENLPRNFKFKEYCPQVFRNLRERFGVDDLDYQASLTRNCPTKDGDSEEEKVSFTSYDCTLSVNQLCSEDVEDVHNILSDYHQHIATCHGITLLPQLLGMYRVTVDNEDTYLIVLRNMFSHRRLIHRKYDLKVKDLYAFKDADLRTNTLRIYISDEDKEKFMTKLSRDVEQEKCANKGKAQSIQPQITELDIFSRWEYLRPIKTGDLFLVRLKITDYSLLLGVHDVEVEEEEGADSPCEDEEDTEDGVGVACPPAASLAPACEGGAGGGKPTSAGALRPCTEAHAIQSTEGTPHREVYFMGLIDILMHSDTKRKAVHAAKTVRHGPGAETSTANAEQYGQRFLECITNIIS